MSCKACGGRRVISERTRSHRSRKGGGLSEPARVFSVLATDRGLAPPPVNFQAGMQQPGILQPAEADSTSIGHRRFSEGRGGNVP
jgi:hypothetical protein